jgi:DnaK suppressor protein
MTGDLRSESMPGKKPALKTSKPKKVPSAKPAPRRADPHKVVAASRKAVAASTAKPEAKLSKKSETEASNSGAAAAPRAAPTLRTLPAEENVKPLSSPITSRVRTLPEPEEAEADADGPEAGSLLAGPRNVKPYVAKRGEQYMSKEQLAHFQQILLTWKRDLMEEVDRTVSHMKDEAANFPDPNDRATQEEEFSLELRTRDRERKLIRKIDEALKRIEDGSYGYCLETGEEIGIKRLEARPVATLSIEAQERRERRERQYGDRDDRYR